jgi:hypothetical protein
MSGARKPTNIEALDQLTESVKRVTSTITKVLVKFPRNTLPSTLAPFMYRHSDPAVKRSQKGDEIVLTISSGSKTTNLRFPATLLDAQESVITRWARDQYWYAIKEGKAQARRAAHAKVSLAVDSLQKAQRDLETARKHLSEVSAVPRKKSPRTGRAE